MNKLLHGDFFEKLDEFGTSKRTAVICNGNSFSYEHMRQRIEEISAFLLAAGIVKGNIVALMTQRSFDSVAAVYAIMSIGAVYLPVDRDFPVQRVSYMLDISNCQFILTDAAGCAEQFTTKVTELNLQEAKGNRVKYDPSLVNPDDLAYVLFTSGSTGRPKGVMVKHSSSASRMAWVRSQLTLADLRLVLCATSYSFDISILELFAPLGYGGAIALVDSPIALANHSFELDVTLINTTPSVMSAILAVNHLPASVKTCFLAGEVLHGALVRELYEQGVNKVYNLYGPTEDTIYSIAYMVPHNVGDSVPIGQTLPGTIAEIVDENMQPVSSGQPGQLCLMGDGLAAGYINRPDLTEERFVTCTNGQFKGARLYLTGDLVTLLPSGIFHCMGRIDDQVKLDGRRIELQEIVQTITALNEIAQAAVVVSDVNAGSQFLAAYCVPAKNTHLNNDELMILIEKEMAARLPQYMLPRGVMLLDHLPTTISGKLDKKALPPIKLNEADRDVKKAQDAVDNALQAVLGNVEFFEDESLFLAGVTSLDLMRILAWIQQNTTKHLPVQEAFRDPSPNGLRLLLASSQVGSRRTVIEPVEPLAISSAQYQMWLAQKMADDPRAYLIYIDIDAVCNATNLCQAIEAVLKRHRVLEMPLVLNDDGKLERVIANSSEPAVAIHNKLPQWPELESRHLDSDKPLTAAVAAHSTGAIARLLIDHTVFDRWSLAVLEKELNTFIEQGLSDCIPAPSGVLRQETDGEAFIERVIHSLAQVKPLGLRCVDRQITKAQVLSIELPQPAVQALRECSARLSITTAAAALGLLGETAHRITGVSALSIGVTLADRHHGNDQYINCNVNTLPFCWENLSRSTLDDRLNAVSNRLFDYVSHSYIGISSILHKVRELRGDTTWNPYDIAFGYYTEPVSKAVGSASAQFVSNPYARLPLTLWIEEKQGRLNLSWTSHPKYFDTSDLQRWHHKYLQVIIETSKHHNNENLAYVSV